MKTRNCRNRSIESSPLRVILGYLLKITVSGVHPLLGTLMSTIGVRKSWCPQLVPIELMCVLTLNLSMIPSEDLEFEALIFWTQSATDWFL